MASKTIEINNNYYIVNVCDTDTYNIYGLLNRSILI